MRLFILGNVHFLRFPFLEYWSEYSEIFKIVFFSEARLILKNVLAVYKVG